jgi:transketolase C-terminal domain/subunit
MQEYFIENLYQKMCKDDNIYFLHTDSQNVVYSKILEMFPERCFNFENAKNCILNVSCGIAQNKKIPIIYVTGPSLIFKSSEVLRSYVNYHNIPVIIIYAGKGQELKELGQPHWSNDMNSFLSQFDFIKKFDINSVNDIGQMLDSIIMSKSPSIIELSIY